jgi:hypothetical protein
MHCTLAGCPTGSGPFACTTGFPSQALGFALPCAERGMQVTIFEDRVETVSRTAHASFYRVLAHTLAHELGHVLLRSKLHGKSGLMKANWTENDWQRAAVTMIPFSPDDVRSIARQLGAIRTMTSHNDQFPIQAQSSASFRAKTPLADPERCRLGPDHPFGRCRRTEGDRR